MLLPNPRLKSMGPKAVGLHWCVLLSILPSRVFVTLTEYFEPCPFRYKVKKKCIFVHEALVDTRNSDKPIDIFPSPSSSTTSSVQREPGTFTSTHPISLKLSTSVYAGSPSPVSLPQFENAILKRKKLTLIWALRLSPP
ncbi:hypothetical protein K435DRAFT_426998 [Dendrothele bispora CBS 962.96]|uniref:Uncharacterized protein n=1 Tax=Dendrothele bispora (strain CBS 962.96) TaxID=1314807 RepID=A0A4V4HCI0_DENBC|nr:hypothetical protein K435DRAFT_426998 [Dendrothele bispora CBS 962.96]